VTADTAPQFVIEMALNGGSVSPGCYRVVVMESNGKLGMSDFDSLESASCYANDVASESDVPSPMAYIFDDKLRFVDRGHHYARHS
jgi:hypothetical protein